MSFVLTPENYYSHDRPHVSMSMIKDYMKSPAFYKRRYVDRDPRVQVVPTDAMKRGTVVDDLLTRGITVMQPRVLKKDNPDLYEMQKGLPDAVLIGQGYWDEAMEIVDVLKQHPLWLPAEDVKSKHQVILQGKEYGMPLCGMADRVDTHADRTIEIIDAKVVAASKIDSPQKWLWNTIEMRYSHQFALYQHLLSKMRKIPLSNISCRHVVASYIEPGLVIVKSYKMPQKLLDDSMIDVTEALLGIADKNFEERPSAILELPYY